MKVRECFRIEVSSLSILRLGIHSPSPPVLHVRTNDGSCTTMESSSLLDPSEGSITTMDMEILPCKSNQESYDFIFSSDFG